jgi:hypothetical protein
MTMRTLLRLWRLLSTLCHERVFLSFLYDVYTFSTPFPISLFLLLVAPIGGIFFCSSTMVGYMARRLGVYGISFLIPTL